MGLSICMIAKNEENTIGRCLSSVRQIAEEIIVVDTGSTDQTIAIAKEHGANVIKSQWENDFSKARNISLEWAREEWILILDCDECLRPEEAEKLRYLIAQPTEAEAYHFRLLNYIGGRVTSSATVLRLFRNNPKYRFRGKMHEQIINTIVAGVGEVRIKMVPIEIDHYGYDDATSSQQEKSKRNLDLLLSYPEEEKDGYYAYSLGNEYARLNQWEKAASLYEQEVVKLEYQQSKPVYYAYLVMHLATAYYQQRYYDEVIRVCDGAERHLKDFKDLYLTKSLTYRQTGELKLAQIYAQKYLACKESPFEYPAHQYQEEEGMQLVEELAEVTLEPCHYTCIVINEETPSLWESIRNSYNSAYKIFALIPATKRESLKHLAEKLSHHRVEVIILEEDMKENFTVGLPNRTRNQWVLILKDDELLPFSALRLLPDLCLL